MNRKLWSRDPVGLYTEFTIQKNANLLLCVRRPPAIRPAVKDGHAIPQGWAHQPK
ncbi:hypothetical protein [Caldalkalibacillus thermarum]|uniref:hypothetical protein n=1 Tax=Caldalkalibacillus thermarum TaxID=296745 RepID=UPI00166A96C7|nr:hypothetical protein [Caldalkalibacillus thermarum]